MMSSLEEKRDASSEVAMRRLRVPTSSGWLGAGPAIKVSFDINTSITELSGECGAGHQRSKITVNVSAGRANAIQANTPQILALGPK